MGASVDGVRLLRVVGMPDTRVGNEGKTAIVVLYMVDQHGPFGFEVDREEFHLGTVITRMRTHARAVRTLLGEEA